MNRYKIVLLVIISIFLFTKCTIKDAEAKFSATIIDFGQKMKSDTLNGEITVENVGDKDLFLQAIQTSCGCTVAKFSKGAIKKNEKTKIQFVYIPKESDKGIITKEILVKSNSSKRLQVIKIKAII